MALRVNFNRASSIAHRSFGSGQVNDATRAKRLATGLRINKASDDVVGIPVSGRLELELRGLNQTHRNAQDGISLVQTAEGAMGGAHPRLARMRELAVPTADVTKTPADRNNILTEPSSCRSTSRFTVLRRQRKRMVSSSSPMVPLH
jgi:flagellin